jgi:hypothetical protein
LFCYSTLIGAMCRPFPPPQWALLRRPLTISCLEAPMSYLRDRRIAAALVAAVVVVVLIVR